jgi:2-methylcitrate dehydratase PrpD
MTEKRSVVLADYILRTTFDELPESVIQKTKEHILDTIGVALASGKINHGLASKIYERFGGRELE